jgi:putative ABC transport system permease protein
VLGFVPGAAAATYLYKVAAGATRLPLHMTAERGLTVFGLMLLVCVVSGFLALRKVRKLDPAEVFG